MTYKAAAISGRQLSLIPELLPNLHVDTATEHGEVFTREWVVDLILDLVGYTADRDLAGLVAVEPACGTGAFLGSLVRRLSASCRVHGRSITDAYHALQAYDLLGRNIGEARNLVRYLLTTDGWSDHQVDEVLGSWLRVDDYLLAPCEENSTDFVVGNPPYIRLEEIPDVRMRAYREACQSMTGRSDIYVGFFEVGLRSLRLGGQLGFICADRWMRNQYGRQLRHLISNQFAVELVMSMHDVDAFEERVSAYPAITVIRRGGQSRAVVADTTAQFSASDAREVLAYVRNEEAAPIANHRYEIARVPHWFSDDASWPAGGPQRIAMIEDLADRFGPLEDPRTGTRVGIGVATGSDEVFITKTPPNDVEDERLLPLAMARDLSTGRLAWSGNYLINPWLADGSLVNLRDYPGLRKYLEANKDKLAKRHVAERSPSNWYRTIDKVDGKLTAHQKLLIPDMRMTIHPVLDDGTAYPHHNLYYVVSDTWDLRVLGGLLLSRVAQAFIEAYAVRMRGGTLRFQAQYLRKIRVPQPADLTPEDRNGLANAFEKRDVEAATAIALRLYGLEELPLDFDRRRKISNRD
ncbi:MAG TPA: Eco57I restriction-modification methylase domain-containing protein [Trebonia sp.]|nr:Eco57I restriction-modification methylase domain-containing protein [Trebonia sp.]